MKKISAVIITKNEEENIERCLKSLSWIDEIVVVDSGSTDRTVEICKSYGCKVIETEWLGYGKTKQLAVNSATHDWILSIDADEQVAESSVSVIKEAIESGKHTSYKVQIKSFYLGKLIKHSGWGNEFKLRIFNKQYGNYNDAEIHETVLIEGESRKLNAVFYHYTYPTLEKHCEKVNRYSTLQGRELFEKGKRYPFLLFPIFALNKFFTMYWLKGGFLDGKEGFILAVVSACGVFMKYAKYWKLKREKAR